METTLVDTVREIKLSCLATGIQVTKEAEGKLSAKGSVPITIHEYATTGGVTMILPGEVYLNAPFDEWFCKGAEALLSLDPDGNFVVRFQGEEVLVRMLPLPGYLNTRDSKGRLVSDVAMSHADRVRLSPTSGCVYSCQFCDMAATKYTKRPLDQFIQALGVARADANLPVKHGLISGGTTSPSDQRYFDEVCRGLIAGTDFPFDVMMTPRTSTTIIDSLFDWGITGYALNMEVFTPDLAATIIPQKHRLGHGVWRDSIQRAVELTGGKGRVRSLLVTGLESVTQTLEGVEFLARLGCDPVLSPFRPARNTAMVRVPPPTTQYLREVYEGSLDVVHRYGVELGPRCIPCQHNTLTFPGG